MQCRLLAILMLIAISSARELPQKRQATTETTLCATGPTPFNTTSPVTFRAQQNLIYVDAINPVACYGRVEQIETCFILDNEVSGDQVLDVIQFRRTPNDGYVVQTALNLKTNKITESDDAIQDEVLYCQNITVPTTTPILVQDGDLLGFRVTSGVAVAFTLFPATVASLRSVTIAPSLGAETITRAELTIDSRANDELPMFRAFVVFDEDSVDPADAPGACPTDGNGGGGGGGGADLNFNNIYNTTFTSFVTATIVAIVIIFFMVLMLAGCGMSLCKEKYKMLHKVCCCCRRKKKGYIRRMTSL